MSLSPNVPQQWHLTVVTSVVQCQDQDIDIGVVLLNQTKGHIQCSLFFYMHSFVCVRVCEYMRADSLTC